MKGRKHWDDLYKKIKHIYSDPYYKDKFCIDENNLIKKSDVIIVTVPHNKYKKLKISKNKKIVDIWNVIPK